MSSQTSHHNVEPPKTAPAARLKMARPARPPARWSDLWKAPLHDFPLRDEILFQFLPLSREMDVLEIGPGSGFTAFRISRMVRHVTLVDVAPQAVTDRRARPCALTDHLICPARSWIFAATCFSTRNSPRQQAA